MFKAFDCAFAGLKYATRHEHNVRIELVCACLALCAGFIITISPLEWCIIILCISSVLFLEIINTAIEKLCDRVHAGYDASIGLIKDLSAAAVLVASVAALVSGAIVFIPKIVLIIKS